MSYPFPSFPYPGARPQVIRPNEVDDIVSAVQCQGMVNASRDAALLKAAAFNDPLYYQYAESFNVFANGDQAVVKNYGNGNTTLAYQGGCDLLASPQSRELWPWARENLRQNLELYNTGNLPPTSTQGTGGPTLECQKSFGRPWTCDR